MSFREFLVESVSLDPVEAEAPFSRALRRESTAGGPAFLTFRAIPETSNLMTIACPLENCW